MIGPKISPFTGALCGLGSSRRMLSQNSKMPIDKFNLSRADVFFLDQGQGCLPELTAEAALEVGEFNECDRGLVASFRRTVFSQIGKNVFPACRLRQGTPTKKEKHCQAEYSGLHFENSLCRFFKPT